MRFLCHEYYLYISPFSILSNSIFKTTYCCFLKSKSFAIFGGYLTYAFKSKFRSSSHKELNPFQAPSFKTKKSKHLKNIYRHYTADLQLFCSLCIGPWTKIKIMKTYCRILFCVVCILFLSFVSYVWPWSSPSSRFFACIEWVYISLS